MFIRYKAASLAFALILLGVSVSSAIELPVQDFQGIPFISGGVGLEEREELGSIGAGYSLKLEFAQRGSGAYLADVQVMIEDTAGNRVFEASSTGPWLLVGLPAGAYRVRAQSSGATVEASVTIPTAGQAQAVLRFPVD
ncbi:MAG: carboxypeptidase-like regulatory domain-containing protein [Pseudomonadota bacterium]|nr:carboxypeptidase-like regulatory domain-containing protein [Pseudomonadota bacterium]